MAHDRFLATRRSFSWIQKYIFPGGIIPSLQAIDDTLAAHTTLRVTQQRELRPHYARTLHLWRERFNDQWPHIHAQGFDETFRRMWEFYLAYCEAGFRSGYLGVSQLQLTREAGMKLNGKVAWVVGASSGIGAAVARELARRGGHRRDLGPPRGAAPGGVGRGHARRARRRHRRRLRRGRRRASTRQELGPIDLAVLSAGYWKQMDPAGLGHRGLRPAPPGQPRRDEQLHRGRAARHAAGGTTASSPASRL